MSELVQQHLARLKAATVSKQDRRDLAKWIEQNTYIGGKRWSYKNHEFQERIASDDSQEIVIIKSAQLGVSELSLRMAAGLVMLMPGAFSVGYVFPNSGFSAQYSKTRFNPIVQGSPALRNAIGSGDLDAAEVKTFGPGKQIYFKGASTGQSAISTTLDAIIFDEYSFMDQEVAGDYTSRLIHSDYKIKVRLSTPTHPGDPISSAFESSRQWLNFCKCHHCGERFYPSFYDHVRISGFDRHLDEITQDSLHTVDYSTARLHCPKCGEVPSLQPEHREWVLVNPESRHLATGYRLSPFDAPNVISVPYLIEASTSYASKAKFRQFNLGLPAADAESGLTSEDLDRIGVETPGTTFTTHVMGIDLGLTCHFAIGGLDPQGRLGIVHYERVPLSKFRERYFHLKSEYRVSITVSDIQPFSDLVMSVSADDSNLFGALYVTRQGLELFDVKDREADPDSALAGVRQVHINRNAAFDKFLADVRDGKVWVRKRPDWELFKTHLQDMKRASATLRNGEYTSVWTKSAKGQDHYHHAAAAYLATAAQMRGIASGALSSHGPAVSTFRLRRG
jgi:hypothetical protein